MRYLVMAALLFLLLAEPDSSRTISELRSSCRAQAYQPPADADLARAQELFLLLFAGTVGPRTEELCTALSMTVSAHEFSGRPFLVLREQEEGEKRGWGFYVFRVGKGTETVVEAPHSFYDRNTGKLAEYFMTEGTVAAGAWNTAHRYRSGDDADLCHTEDSMMQRFTRAFAYAYPEGRLVQMHGFAQSKRKTEAGRNSRVILSNGTSTPGTVTDLAECLRSVVSGNVSVYRDDVRELGGTKNKQGMELRSLDHEGFLHFELSSHTRSALLGDQDLRKSVWDCLEQ